LHPDENGEAVDQHGTFIHPHDWLPLVPHGDTTRHSVCFVHAFKLFYALHINKLFSRSSDISNTHSNLEFGTPLLHRLILLAFLMLILSGVKLIEKITSRTCHFLGSSLICWSSRKQSSIAQSTTEAKYVAAASCCSQIL
jgi:hypothetical protein